MITDRMKLYIDDILINIFELPTNDNIYVYRGETYHIEIQLRDIFRTASYSAQFRAVERCCMYLTRVVSNNIQDIKITQQCYRSLPKNIC